MTAELITVEQLLGMLSNIQRLRKFDQKQLAKWLGVSAAHLNDVLLRRKQPGQAIAEPLGYKPERMYRKVGPNIRKM
jgi:hypothetical protein